MSQQYRPRHLLHIDHRYGWILHPDFVEFNSDDLLRLADRAGDDPRPSRKLVLTPAPDLPVPPPRTRTQKINIVTLSLWKGAQKLFTAEDAEDAERGSVIFDVFLQNEPPCLQSLGLTLLLN